MRGGYMGKILNVDLSSGKIEEEALDEEMCRDFIGGHGLGARVMFSRQKPGVDPLGPENILGFVTGPLTGTPVLFGCRYNVVAKSPVTSTFGHASSGGDFGPFLKFSGYDAVFVSGISEKPVYLFVNDGKAELKDANLIWGKDTRETKQILRAELGDDVEFAMIGPAAEKLSLICGITGGRGRSAGRTGMGTVMGAKKLKAIAVRGTADIPIAYGEEVARLGVEGLARVAKDEFSQSYIKGGTMSEFESLLKSGVVPFKNWAGDWPMEVSDFSSLYNEKLNPFRSRAVACWGCPIPCMDIMKEGTGEYKWEAGAARPQYQTVSIFGPLCLNSNLESIIKCNDICNRYGIDTMSAGVTIAFAMECYEKGLITKEDTDGIELTWGNHQAIVAMLEKLVKREGFGDVLADGVKLAAERIGKGSEQYAMHIHGLEVASRDPKQEPFYATSHIAQAVPGRHCTGSEMFDPKTGFAYGKHDPTVYTGRGEAHKIGRNFTHALEASGLCMFLCMAFNLQDIFNWMNAVTGWELEKPEELLVCGERISNLIQAFSIREGMSLQDVKIPGRMIGNPPLKKGPTAGRTVDYELMVKDFLKASDWDLKTGKPSKEKLLSLGLDNVAAELWP